MMWRLVLALGSLLAVSADFLSSCPALCQCKWSSGKQTADCARRDLTTVPQDIHPDVQVLIMDGNYIKELPKNVFSNLGLNHLQKISLRDASVQSIHESAFADLRILKEINLQGNNISVLPPQAFQGNTGLRTLLLGENKIVRLKAHQFPPLRNLRKIDLSGNRLESVHKLAFQNLAQGDVEEIDLSDNLLTKMSDKTFTALGDKLKHLPLHGNPWLCDCQLKSFRDFVVHRALSTGPGVATCAEPVRLADRPWDRVKSQEFACRPEVQVTRPRVFALRGQNATLECRILGNPVPAVKWVLHGRVIQNRSSPLKASPGQLYIINSVATREGGIERNYSLTITGVTTRDLGSYSCVAINAGGVSEMEVQLTFDSGGAAGLPFDEKEMTIIIGVASGVLLILLVLLLLLCCCCRSRRDKGAASPRGSLLGYPDPAGEKLLPGPPGRANPLPKPVRTGQYMNGGPGEEQEMLSYGPASYVPGDRYDLGELGEGRGSASNSDRTGTLSRASYHSSDPDQYPDLLDLPARGKQPSPTSTTSTLYDTARVPHHPALHHNHHHHQPLHPGHLISPPHLHHHHASAFQRPAYSSGTLPHPHHPRSVSCDHTSAQAAPGPYLPVQTGHQQRPGYVTLPRRPRASWAGQAGQAPRDTPSPAFSLRDQRDPVYDGVGPRTSADGSSSINLNKSVDGAGTMPRQKAHPSLPPYCPPIKEECAPPRPAASVQFNGLPALEQDKPSVLAGAQSCGSVATLGGLEENLSAYFEPFGAALAPSPGARDSIASNESDTVQLLPKDEVGPALAPIPESEPAPGARARPPPTLPKPKLRPPPTLPKPGPAPPPKPKPRAELASSPLPVTEQPGFQDETFEGSEI